MATESPTTNTPSAFDPALLAYFKWVVGRDPNPAEMPLLQTIYSSNPTLALSRIDALGAQEKGAGTGTGSTIPDGYQHLVIFTDDPTAEPGTGTNTVWLFDAKDHSLNGTNYSGTLIPFATEEGFNKFFNGRFNLDDAIASGSIHPLPTSALKSDPTIANSRLVRAADGINNNGEMSQVEALRWRYGKPVDEAGEDRAMEELKRIFTIIKEKDPNFKEHYYTNAFTGVNGMKYTMALTHGGYDPQSIYRDIIAHNKRVEGDPLYANYKGLSLTQNAGQWTASNPDYKFVTSGTGKIDLPDIPTIAWKANALGTIFSLLPKDAFRVPFDPKSIDFNDPKVIEEIEKIQDFVGDVAIQMAEAENQRDVDAANYNWNVLKEDIERSLGIQLEGNAFDAWGQIESLKSSMSERGTTNSGIYNRALDMVMRNRRLSDARIRESALDQKDQELRVHLLNNASDEDIAKFIDERGLETAKEWGLIPSDELTAFLNFDNLKKLYPEVSDDEINDVIETVIGKTASGQAFYKSTIMRNHVANVKNLIETSLDRKKQAYVDEKIRTDEKAFKDFTEGGKFDDLGLGTDPAAPGQPGAPGATSTNKMPAGVLVRNTADGKVYFVDANKQLRYVTDPSWIKGAHVQNVDPSHFNGVTYGAKITTQPIAADGKPMLFKGGAEAKAMFDKVGIDWTKPRGYDMTKPTSSLLPGSTPSMGMMHLMVARSDGKLTVRFKYPDGKQEDFVGTREEVDRRYKDLKSKYPGAPAIVDDMPVTKKPAPGGMTEFTLPKVSSFTSMTETPKLPAGVSPSDSRYWSINPNNVLSRPSTNVASNIASAITSNKQSTAPTLLPKTSAPAPAPTGSWTKGTITYNPNLHGQISDQDLINQGFKKS